jgi:hypothetical protein
MPTVKVEAWKCGECGHRWLSEEKPKRCARCKSRRWDEGGTTTPAAKGSKKVIPDWPEEIPVVKVVEQKPPNCQRGCGPMKDFKTKWICGKDPRHPVVVK